MVTGFSVPRRGFCAAWKELPVTVFCEHQYFLHSRMLEAIGNVTGSGSGDESTSLSRRLLVNHGQRNGVLGHHSGEVLPAGSHSVIDS
jgi:hypothetical protein